MRKLILGVLFAVCFLGSSAAAQNAVPITDGKFSVFGVDESFVKTPLFTALGSFPEDFESVWYNVCGGNAFCRSGTTFTLPYQTRIGENIGTALPFRSGIFSNAQTEKQNVYYSGILKFADFPSSPELSVTIPKLRLRAGGLYTIRRPFTLQPTSRLKVCAVSALNAPCPADKILFDGAIQGRGTVTVTLRASNQNPRNPQLVRESFIYKFQQ